MGDVNINQAIICNGEHASTDAAILSTSGTHSTRLSYRRSMLEAVCGDRKTEGTMSPTSVCARCYHHDSVRTAAMTQVDTMEQHAEKKKCWKQKCGGQLSQAEPGECIDPMRTTTSSCAAHHVSTGLRGSNGIAVSLATARRVGVRSVSWIPIRLAGKAIHSW